MFFLCFPFVFPWKGGGKRRKMREMFGRFRKKHYLCSRRKSTTPEMMDWSKNVRRSVAGLLIALFGIYYTNVSLCLHTHIVGGTTIVHSHFHRAKHHSTPTGEHTCTQLQLISILNTISCTDDVCISISFSPILIPTERHDFSYTEQIFCPSRHKASPRAPPFAVNIHRG